MRSRDLLALADALNRLATLYQFRNPNDRVFGAFTVTQSYCLRILYLKGPRSMSALASELGIRVSTMTGVIDQLETKGIVERVDHPQDRRSLHVSLSAKGRTLYHSAHEAFLSHLEPLFAERPAEARHEILGFLDDTIEAIQGWRRQPRKVRRHGKTHS